jgi:hypothetical protein
MSTIDHTDVTNAARIVAALGGKGDRITPADLHWWAHACAVIRTGGTPEQVPPKPGKGDASGGGAGFKQGS